MVTRETLAELAAQPSVGVSAGGELHWRGLFIGLHERSGRTRMELSVDYIEALYEDRAVSGFLSDLRQSATDLASSLENTVTDMSTAKPDLSAPEKRLELVRSLWREILKVEDVRDDVNFFDAGGDSLLLIMLVERMTQASGSMVKTMDLFRAGTVRGHAELLASAADKAAPGSAASARDRLLSAARNGSDNQN